MALNAALTGSQHYDPHKRLGQNQKYQPAVHPMAVESRDDRYTDDATVERGGLGRSPVTVTCPHCKSNITTVTTLENGKAVWIAAVALTLICCCCIPFCIDDLKDAVHSCPSCKERIGTHKKI